MNITPEPKVNETEGQPQGATEGEAGTNQEQEKLQKYIQEFDSIFSDREFQELLTTNTVLTNVFNRIKFSDLNASLYQHLSKLPATIRKSTLNTIKEQLNNSTLSDELKAKIKLLDNFITPPKC